MVWKIRRISRRLQAILVGGLAGCRGRADREDSGRGLMRHPDGSLLWFFGMRCVGVFMSAWCKILRRKDDEVCLIINGGLLAFGVHVSPRVLVGFGSDCATVGWAGDLRTFNVDFIAQISCADFLRRCSASVGQPARYKPYSELAIFQVFRI